MKLSIKLDLYLEIGIPEDSDRSKFSAIVRDNQLMIEDYISTKLKDFRVSAVSKVAGESLAKAGATSCQILSKRQLLAVK